MSLPSDRLECRWVIESMRNGVPNRQAVARLECNQPRIQKRVHKMLEDLETLPQAVSNKASHFILASGDFGQGKSHLLANLAQDALERGFATSSIVVSKETPLYKLDAMFRMAAGWGRLPDSSGLMVEDAWDRLLRRRDAVDALITELEAGQYDLHPIFPATLRVRFRCGEEDLNSEIGLFWAGEKIRIARVKEGLKLIGSDPDISMPPVKTLPPQRLLFLSLLLRAAGCRGWVVFLDELELIDSYSRLQRGRAYAELARWAGVKPYAPVPGLVVVGAITGDFDTAVLSNSGKGDRGKLPILLQEKGPDLEKAAVAGMKLFSQKGEPLVRPNISGAQRMVDSLRDIYNQAYDCEAKPLDVKDLGPDSDLPRARVRKAIRLWDRDRYQVDQPPQS
ncbi:MAG: DUF2791 family P-loop domain-containing protein [Caldilineaceae bacterium]|nr:DUF2791 family P-loop domain-containing protein [Caldilineaceae bacterium]